MHTATDEIDFRNISRVAQLALAQLVRDERSVFKSHPLGFLVRVLETLPTGERIRLHVWHASLRGNQGSELSIHSHPFELSSYIVFGRLRNITYDVVHSASGENRLFSVSYDDQHSVLTPTHERVSWRALSETKLADGGQYHVPAGQFHATYVPPEAMAATIVITGPEGAAQARVVGPDIGSPIQYRRSDQNLPSEMLEEVLEQLRRVSH